MNLHFSFKSAKSPEIEKEIQQHVQKLDKFLQVFRPDLVHLHGALENEKRHNYAASLNLRLPTGQLSTRDSGDSPTVAVKVAFNDLIGQLKRHKELLRNEHKWQRQRSQGRSAQEATALETIHKVVNHVQKRESSRSHPYPASSDSRFRSAEIDAAVFAEENQNLFQSDVRSYFNANLSRLERFIERELRFLEASGVIRPGLVTKDEVLDEVVVAALSQSGDEKPEQLSVERWLYRLAILAIQRIARGNGQEESAMPLEQSVGKQNVTASDDAFFQYHQPGESMSREDVTPDLRMGNPEEIAATDEMIEQLDQALLSTTPAQRESFVLFALEGFTVQEIAQVTDRPIEKVKEGILGARAHLIKKLPNNHVLKGKLVRRSSVA